MILKETRRQDVDPVGIAWDTDHSKLWRTRAFLKMSGISWLPEEMLASQEGLSSTDLVTCVL
jgi:hypothetical protein